MKRSRERRGLVKLQVDIDKSLNDALNQLAEKACITKAELVEGALWKLLDEIARELEKAKATRLRAADWGPEPKEE